MAHADYECCAVCASKMTYGGGHKATVCASCAIAFYKAAEVEIDGPTALVAWVEIHSAERVREVLSKVGFEWCYGDGEVDLAVAKKLGIKPGFLEPIGKLEVADA